MKGKVSETERLQQMNINFDKLLQAIASIQPTKNMYENLDDLLLNIKQIHYEALNRVEKAVEEFREKRLWSGKPVNE
jgi:hypothetical protein